MVTFQKIASPVYAVRHDGKPHPSDCVACEIASDMPFRSSILPTRGAGNRCSFVSHLLLSGGCGTLNPLQRLTTPPHPAHRSLSMQSRLQHRIVATITFLLVLSTGWLAHGQQQANRVGPGCEDLQQCPVRVFHPAVGRPAAVPHLSLDLSVARGHTDRAEQHGAGRLLSSEGHQAGRCRVGRRSFACTFSTATSR